MNEREENLKVIKVIDELILEFEESYLQKKALRRQHIINKRLNEQINALGIDVALLYANKALLEKELEQMEIMNES
jgi:hypothetical protein